MVSFMAVPSKPDDLVVPQKMKGRMKITMEDGTEEVYSLPDISDVQQIAQREGTISSMDSRLDANPDDMISGIPAPQNIQGSVQPAISPLALPDQSTQQVATPTGQQSSVAATPASSTATQGDICTARKFTNAFCCSASASTTSSSRCNLSNATVRYGHVSSFTIFGFSATSNICVSFVPGTTRRRKYVIFTMLLPEYMGDAFTTEFGCSIKVRNFTELRHGQMYYMLN